jgi:two-component system sensor histidine kinase VicK
MVLAVWLSRYLVRPLRSLEETAHVVGEGDFDQRTRVMTADEIGTVAIAFNDMVERLQRLVQGQRLFIANASHELRTPLTNIKLRSEALVDLADGDQSEEDLALTRRYIEEIDSEADRLSRLANTLLDLSRLDSLERKPATEAVDLAPLLHSIAHSIQLRVDQAQQTFDVDIPEALPPLWVWPDQIETIILNLLDNAIKYTPSGGTISMKVDVTSQHCRLYVEDTGPGIPVDELSHIFEQFYRVDKARGRQGTGFGVGSGAGLGLSLIKTLVERNGGTISVESELDDGSLFTVTFPTFLNNPQNQP